MSNQASVNLELGSLVRVIRKAENHESGWQNTWSKKMDKTIGEVGEVSGIFDGQIRVYFPQFKDFWFYPPFVLACGANS